MKKILFVFILFTTPVFSKQIAKLNNKKQPIHKIYPSQTAAPLRTIEPPQEILLDPDLHCKLNLKFEHSNMVQLEYEIDDLSNKSSKTKQPTIFDVTFITLTFTPNKNTTEVSCMFKNIAVYFNWKYIPPCISCILLNNIILNNCSFDTQEFNNPEVIKYLIEISLSTYFRQYVLKCKQCTICLNEINNQEPAILVKCGNAAHEKCLKANAVCRACGEYITKDLWHRLSELPEKIK